MSGWGHASLYFVTFRLAGAVCVSAALVSVSQQAHAGVQVPCRSSTQKTGELEACEKVIPRVKQEIQTALQDDVDAKYRGQDKGAYGNPDRVFPVPVCSVTANELTGGKKEVSVNHIQKPCGRGARVHAWRAGKRAKVRLEYQNGWGTMDKAYESGAWVQALACSMKEAFRDIEQNKSVESPAPDSVVRDYQGHLKYAQEAAITPEEVAKCDSKTLDSGQSDGRDDVSRNKLLSCQANAYREQLQVAFKQITMLAIYARAEQYWAKFMSRLYDQPNMGVIKRVFQDAIKRTCQGKGNMQRCYERELEGTVRKAVVEEIIAKGCGERAGGVQ